MTDPSREPVDRLMVAAALAATLHALTPALHAIADALDRLADALTEEKP